MIKYIYKIERKISMELKLTLNEAKMLLDIIENEITQYGDFTFKDFNVNPDPLIYQLRDLVKEDK